MFFVSFQLYSKAIESDSETAELYVNRAHILLKLLQYPEAKKDALSAINLCPNDPKAHLRKGVACFHLEQYQEALEAFKASSNFGGKILFFSWNFTPYSNLIY